MTTKMVFEKKFGNKMYKLVFVESNSLHIGYGGETSTKNSAERKGKMLRAAGFNVRVVREMHIRIPTKGPEIFYAVYARKEGLTLDQVEAFGMEVLGRRF